MKRYVLSLIFAVAVVAGWAADKNFLVADNVQAPIGAQYVTLPIKMTNANKISDVQFDLQLPSGCCPLSSNFSRSAKGISRFQASGLDVLSLSIYLS